MSEPYAINRSSDRFASSWTMVGFDNKEQAEAWADEHESMSRGYDPRYQFVEDSEHGWTIRCHMYNSCD